MAQVTGGCLCGKVRVIATGAPHRVGICHCLDCRKHHGALFFVAAIFPQHSVRIEGETGAYKGRHFCRDCGSSVFAQHEGEIEVHLGWISQTNSCTLMKTGRSGARRGYPPSRSITITLMIANEQPLGGGQRRLEARGMQLD